MVDFANLAAQLYLGIPEIENGSIPPDLELLKTYHYTSVNASEIRRYFELFSLPSILLFQVGSGEKKKIFGGYASQSWNLPGPNFGTESSFLFVMSRDGEKVKLRVKQDPPTGVKRILWHNGNNSMGFGYTDLILGEDVWGVDQVQMEKRNRLQLFFRQNSSARAEEDIPSWRRDICA